MTGKTNLAKTKKFLVKRIARKSGVVHEYITIVDEEDAHYLRNSYWIVQLDKTSGYHYIIRKTANGDYEALHTVVIGAAKGERVDHINGKTLDNRKANLLRARDRTQEIV